MRCESSTRAPARDVTSKRQETSLTAAGEHPRGCAAGPRARSRFPRIEPLDLGSPPCKVTQIGSEQSRRSLSRRANPTRRAGRRTRGCHPGAERPGCRGLGEHTPPESSNDRDGARRAAARGLKPQLSCDRDAVAGRPERFESCAIAAHDAVSGLVAGVPHARETARTRARIFTP